MWRPPERLRHQVISGRWPTAAEAAGSRLYSPLAFGALRLEQRTWTPAMVPWRAAEDGSVTPAVVDWYARFAQGRPGAIVVEATGIQDVPSGPLLRISDDRYVPGLRRIADAVRAASQGHTRLFIQLIDFLRIRRRVDRETYLGRFLVPTPEHRVRLGLSAHAADDEVRSRLMAIDAAELGAVLSAREMDECRMGYRERITDTQAPHIADLPRRLPGLFARAAQRARAAGFDGVELHYAHAYTMASFLSPLNQRRDGYGGRLQDRLRAPLEVFDAVRDAVGPDFVVGARYLAEECIEGGFGLAEAVEIGLALARAGADFLSLSRGGKFEDASPPKLGAAAYPYTGPSGYECMHSFISDAQGPFGRNRAPTALVRQQLRAFGFETPVVLAGGIHSFEQAERALQDDQADIIGAARQAMADPDVWLKIRHGRGAEVRVCEYTNYCEALDQKHTEVTCQLWDRKGLQDPAVPRSADGRRRLTAPAWSGSPEPSD